MFDCLFYLFIYFSLVFEQLLTLSKTSAGLAQITSTFSLCTPLQTYADGILEKKKKKQK